jgi:hypothetical protein
MREERKKDTSLKDGARHQWLIPVISAIWEAWMEGSRLEARPAKQFTRPSLQNNQSKMDWKCDSSSRAPVLQVHSPEFQLKSHQNKKKKKKKNWGM